MESGRPRNRASEKLSLEDYIRFVDTNKHYHLTCELLRQVIHMHGFRKGKNPKYMLTDAMESMELMDPARSTLKDDDASSNAFISLAEAVKDLGELNWQECCITSIQMVNSSNYGFPDLVAHNDPIATSSSPVLVRRKRKMKKLEAVEDANATSGGDGEGVGSAESACCHGGEGGGGGVSGGSGVGGGAVGRKVRAKANIRFVGVGLPAE